MRTTTLTFLSVLLLMPFLLIAQYHEGFENGFPNTWHRFVENDNSVDDAVAWEVLSIDGPFSGNFHLKTRQWASNAHCWLVSPGYIPENGDFFSIWISNTSWSGGQPTPEVLDIYLSTHTSQPTSSANFEANPTITIEEQTIKNIYTKFVVDLSAYAGQTVYLGLKIDNSSTWQDAWYADDFSFESDPLVKDATTSLLGDKVSVTFDRDIDAFPADIINQFTINNNGGGNIIDNSKAIVFENNNKLTFTLTDNIMNGDNVTISYTPGTLQGTNGISIKAVTNVVVTNIVPPPPTIESVATNPYGDKIEITFDKAMNNPSGEQTNFTVTADGGPNLVDGTIDAHLVNNNKTIVLTLSSQLQKGQQILLSYTQGNVSSADGQKLNEQNDLNVENNAPGATPKFLNAVISLDGYFIELQFDKAMKNNTKGLQLTVKHADGTTEPVTLGYTETKDDDKTIKIAIVEPVIINTDLEITLSYDASVGDVQGTDNGLLESFTDIHVNNVSQAALVKFETEMSEDGKYIFVKVTDRDDQPIEIDPASLSTDGWKIIVKNNKRGTPGVGISGIFLQNTNTIAVALKPEVENPNQIASLSYLSFHNQGGTMKTKAGNYLPSFGYSKNGPLNPLNNFDVPAVPLSPYGIIIIFSFIAIIGFIKLRK